MHAPEHHASVKLQAGPLHAPLTRAEDVHQLNNFGPAGHFSQEQQDSGEGGWHM